MNSFQALSRRPLFSSSTGAVPAIFDVTGADLAGAGAERAGQVPAGDAEYLRTVQAVVEGLRKFGVTVCVVTPDEPGGGVPPGALGGWTARLSAGEAAALPRLGRDGARSLARTTFLLGGTLHGLCAEQITDSVRHTHAIAALVQAERLRVWAYTYARSLPALDQAVREVIVLAADLPDEAILPVPVADGRDTPSARSRYAVFPEARPSIRLPAGTTW